MTNTSTLNQVERACVQLRHDGKTVTFTAIAAATDLSRTTLYRDPVIRAVIDAHRHAAPDATLNSLTDDIATLRAGLDALAKRMRRQEEQLRRLARKP
jgi:hypothetical protein